MASKGLQGPHRRSASGGEGSGNLGPAGRSTSDAAEQLARGHSGGPTSPMSRTGSGASSNEALGAGPSRSIGEIINSTKKKWYQKAFAFPSRQKSEQLADGQQQQQAQQQQQPKGDTPGREARKERKHSTPLEAGKGAARQKRTPQEQMLRLQQHARDKVNQVQKEKRDLERKIEHLQSQLKSYKHGSGEAMPDPLMGIPRQRMPDKLFANFGSPHHDPLQPFKQAQRQQPKRSGDMPYSPFEAIGMGTRPIRAESSGSEHVGLHNRQGSHASHASGSPGPVPHLPWHGDPNAAVLKQFGLSGGEMNDPPPPSPFGAGLPFGGAGELNGPPPSSPFGPPAAKASTLHVGQELVGPPPASPFGGAGPRASASTGEELNGPPPASPFLGGTATAYGAEMNGPPPASPFGGGPAASVVPAYGSEVNGTLPASPLGGAGGELNGPAPASPFGGPDNSDAGSGRTEAHELLAKGPPASPWSGSLPSVKEQASALEQTSSGSRSNTDAAVASVELTQPPVASPFDAHYSTDSSSIAGLSTLPTPSSGELVNNQRHGGQDVGEELSGRSSLPSPFEGAPGSSQQPYAAPPVASSRAPRWPLSTVNEESSSQQPSSAVSSPASSLKPGSHEELNPRPSSTSPFEGDMPSSTTPSSNPPRPATPPKGEELSARPSLTSPFHEDGRPAAASTFSARPVSPPPPRQPQGTVLAVAELSSHDSLRSPFDTSGQLDAADHPSSPAHQKTNGTGTSAPHAPDEAELAQNPDMPSPFATGLIREGSLSEPPREISVFQTDIGEGNGGPSHSSAFGPGYGAPLAPLAARPVSTSAQHGTAGAVEERIPRPSLPDSSNPAQPDAQPGPALADLSLGSGDVQRAPFEGGELNHKPSMSSPFERKSMSSASGSQAGTTASASRSFSKVASFDQWTSSDSTADAAAAAVANTGQALSTDLNPRPSLPSPFEQQTKQRQQAEGMPGKVRDASSGHAAPFEGGELNPRPSLSSPFEPQAAKGRPPKQPRSISMRGGATSDSPSENAPSEPEAGSQQESSSSSSSKPAALAARLSITPAPASPFDEPPADESSASEAPADSGQPAASDRHEKLHAHVDAAHEAPLMVATLSSMRAPVSPFGDDDESADAEVANGPVQAGAMSAQLSAGWVPISPFGDVEDEEPPAGTSARIANQQTPPSPFAFDGDDSAQDQATPPLRSLASRPSFIPASSSGTATTDVPANSSILWGKGTQIPSSSFHISAAPSAGTTVSSSRPSPRASQAQTGTGAFGQGDAPTSARSAALAAAGSDTAGMPPAASQRAQSAHPSPTGSPLAVHAESEASPLAARPLGSIPSSHTPRSQFEDEPERRASGEEAKRRDGSEERGRPGAGLSTRNSARTGGPNTIPSNVSRGSTASRRESESGALPEEGMGDTMMLMEAYSKLQRENLRLQAKVLRMEDASGKVTQLEELDAKLKKENTQLLTAAKKQPSGSLFGGGDKTSAKQLAEARSELDTLKKELSTYQVENEQLTLDNVKLINHLEEMSQAFGVDLDDPDHYIGAQGDIDSTAHTDSGELSGYAP